MSHRAQAAPERHPDQQPCADYLCFAILVVTLESPKKKSLKKIEN